MTPARNVIARSSLAMLTAAFLITAWGIEAAAAPAQGKTTPAQGKKSQVDVNSADVKALETLPGIGPVLAQRIIEGRPYKTLADLGKVKGLSKAKLDAIKDDLTFGSAPTPAKGTAKKAKAAKLHHHGGAQGAAADDLGHPPADQGRKRIQAAPSTSTARVRRQPRPGSEDQHQYGHSRRVGPPARNWSRQGQGHHRLPHSKR